MSKAMKRAAGEKEVRWQMLIALLVDMRAISFNSYADFWMEAYDYDREACPDLKDYMAPDERVN